MYLITNEQKGDTKENIPKTWSYWLHKDNRAKSIKASQYSGQAKTIPCDIVQDTLQQEASHLQNMVLQKCLLEHISDLAKHHHSRERENKKTR